MSHMQTFVRRRLPEAAAFHVGGLVEASLTNVYYGNLLKTPLLQGAQTSSCRSSGPSTCYTCTNSADPVTFIPLDSRGSVRFFSLFRCTAITNRCGRIEVTLRVAFVCWHPAVSILPLQRRSGVVLLFSSGAHELSPSPPPSSSNSRDRPIFKCNIALAWSNKLTLAHLAWNLVSGRSLKK